MPVVQKVDSGINWTNLYPVDNAIGFSKIYPLRSAIQRLKNQGLDSRPRLGNRTNSIETTFISGQMGVSSNFQVILSGSLVRSFSTKQTF